MKEEEEEKDRQKEKGKDGEEEEDEEETYGCVERVLERVTMKGVRVRSEYAQNQLHKIHEE